MNDTPELLVQTCVNDEDDLVRLWSVLSLVEEFVADQSGIVTLRTSEVVEAIVCVQSGLIAWATSRRMRGRLPELFQNDASGDGAGLVEYLLAEIGQSNDCLECVFRESGIDEQSMRSTLKQHSAEALASIDVDVTPVWTTPGKGNKGARHLFASAELLTEASEWLFPEQVARAKSELTQAMRGRSIGLSYERGRRGKLLLLAAINASTLTVVQLDETGRCAAEIIDLSSSFCPTDRVACSTTPFGTDLVTWASGTFIHCLLCPDPAVLAARLTSVAKLLQLSEDSRPSGTQRVARS